MKKNAIGIIKRILKIIGTIFLIPLVLIFTLIILLYIPAIQKYAVTKCSEIVAQNSDYNLTLGKFRLHFPFSLSITDYCLYQEEDTLLRGDRLRINLNIIPLLKGELEANYISLENTSVNSFNLIDGLNINGKIGFFRTAVRNARLTENTININQLNLTDSNVKLTLTEKTQPEDTIKSSPVTWFISLNKGNLGNVTFNIDIPQDTLSLSTYIDKTQLRNLEIDLEKNSYILDNFILNNSAFKYDKGTIPDSISPIDHLHFNNISFQLKDIEYSPRKQGIHLEHITLNQQPLGLTIKEGELHVDGDTNTLSIDKLYLTSENGTTLQSGATIPWSLINGNNKKEKSDININLNLNKRDLQGILTKENYIAIKELPDSILSFKTILHGNPHKVYIDTVYAEITDLMEIGLNGEGNNLTDKTKKSFDIKFSGRARNIHKLLQSNTLPDSIKTNQLTINGKASLYKGEYIIESDITSGNGTAIADCSYVTTNNSYEAILNFNKFNIEHLIPQIPLRQLTMNMELKGRGTDIYNDSTQYTCNLQIDTIHYDNNIFNDIKLNANQAHSLSNINIKSEEELLQLELQADTKIKKSAITNSTKINIDKIDLLRLGLSKYPIQASMNVELDATTDLNETYIIKSTGENFLFTLKNKQYTPDSLNLIAYTKPDSTYLNLSTGDLYINGHIATGYKSILKSIEKINLLVEKNLQMRDTIFDIREYEQLLPETNLSINCKNKNIFADYMSITGVTYEEINLKCDLDSIKGLNIRGNIFNLDNRKQHLDTIRFALAQENENLKYFAGIRSRATTEEDEKATFGAALYGKIERNNMTTNYIFRDKNDVIGMKLGLTATLKQKGLLFKFSPSAILFKQPFSFNKDNEIFLDKEMHINGNIELRDTTNSGMNLYAVSDSLNKREITLELFNVDLQTVTKTLPFVPELSGIINVNIHYNDSKQGILLNSDIQSQDLTYEGTLIGDETLEFSYTPRNKKEHFAYLTLQHNNKQVAHLEGVYHNDSLNNHNNGELKLTQFPLSIANAFIKETDITASGYIDGEMSINYNKIPIANGYLKFDSAYADLPKLGTNLHLVDDKVEIKNNILKFQNFDIYAKGNTPFKINGTINLDTILNPEFDLRMRANNYELINSKRNKNSILYGRMFVNLNSRITGKLNTLKVNGSATILGKSDITYVLQDTPLETENTLDGLVTFTNFQDTIQTEQNTQEYDLGNINMNITLAIEEGARINADFDQERTSYIELQGEGNLNLTYTGEAGMNLTGRYLLSNGQIKYTLPVIPLKTFNINEGSNINWTGDIMNPTLNITAVERVITSVTIDDNSQAVEFDVGIKLSNTLNNMGLNFTLSSPENAAVQNQLNMLDAETLNKYALTMLITGAYIGGENSLTVSSALSSFLDAQINNFVGNTVNKTVDINVGITDLEDATTGDTYKNYSFSFTKRFWNDRLKVIIGGEVNNNSNANTNESFINNVSLEWKISNSGNRYLRIFYDKNYESILEGEITETGVGYVYKRKLNNLNELLIFKKRNNKERNIPYKQQPQPPVKQQTFNNESKEIK